MADNAGKPGGESGYGGGDPPESTSSRQSTRSYDRNVLSRPPPAVRRDPRADPDDEPMSGRVDVVTVDRGDRNSTIDSLTNAALTLRRELAKLHQQAAAVERTIEDQRRERSDALERAEHISSKNLELEQRAETAERELESLRRLHDQTLQDLQHMRSERDDLSRAVDAAKGAADTAREEIQALKRQQEEVLRAATTFEHEIAEIRKREQAGAQKATATEAELQTVRERAERVTAELASAREEIAQAKAEVVRTKQEANDAAEAAAQKLSESEHERLAAKEAIDRLEKSLAESRLVQEKVVALDADLTNARSTLLETKSEVGRLERDLEDTRHARDVALEGKNMAEKETADVRKEVDRLQQALDAANATIASANARAAASDRARTATEESVRTLRDEITTAFARWRSATPSVAPPPNAGSVAPPTRAVPLSDYGDGVPPAPAIPQEALEPPPPVTRSGAEAKGGSTTATAPPSAMTGPFSKAPSVNPIAVPGHAPVTVSGPPPPPTFAEQKPPSQRPARPSVPPPSASMRASKPPSVKMPSVPPVSASKPPSARMPAAAPISTRQSVAPRASVPPTPPRASVAPSPPRSIPPPLPPRAQSIPPAVYPSVPPAAPVSTSSPPPPQEDSSIVTYTSQEREQLIEQLGSSFTVREAATTLREHPEWLRGRPPIELLLALTQLDYDIEEPVFELARVWDRDPLCRALIAALRDEPDPKLREHGAWLLKHLGSPSSWLALAELVSSEEESPAVRRWLLEAIERLVATRGVGWTEVGELCQRLIRHSNASLRDGIVGVIAALDRSDDKRRLLLEVLRTDHDEVVLSSAVQALTTALPIELDPSVAERLLGHPSPRVQQSVVEFVERSKRAAKNS
ncbi:MAG: hypothetical protein KIT84_29755 [Labilithrix sp.]|nr:hypothetical protein [Labilithrix sp.]MCW5815249.1 hypothetical protein [Labilithrix sp.]